MMLNNKKPIASQIYKDLPDILATKLYAHFV